MTARTIRTTQRPREAFLAALSQGLSVTGAGERAGLARSTVYGWRETDEAFRQAWDHALEAGSDRLEDEAFRRAYHGVAEPVVSHGKLVRGDDGLPLTIQRYSDTLMCLLLKGRRGEKFRERQDIKHSGDADNPILLVDGSARDLLMARIAALAENLPKKPEPILIEETLAPPEGLGDPAPLAKGDND